MENNAAILNDKRILIIEDDQDIAQLLLLHLSDIYRTVQVIHNGKVGFEAGLNQAWDVILLDLRLPDMDGLEICKQLRSHHILTPILMLTSKSTELDLSLIHI